MSGPPQVYDLVDASRHALGVLRCPLITKRDAEVVGDLLEAAIDAAEPLSSQVMTTGELGQAWRVSAETVRGWIEDGELEAFNAGRGTVARWRITTPAALRFASKRQKSLTFHAVQRPGKPETAA